MFIVVLFKKNYEDLVYTNNLVVVVEDCRGEWKDEMDEWGGGGLLCMRWGGIGMSCAR